MEVRKSSIVILIILLLNVVFSSANGVYAEAHILHKGVKNTVTFQGIDVVDNKTGGNHASIQQNFFIKCMNGTSFWVQNWYEIYYIGQPGVDQKIYVRQGYHIWRVVTSGVGDSRWDYFGTSSQELNLNQKIELDSYIKDEELMMSGLQATAGGKDMAVAKVGPGAEVVSEPDDSVIRGIWKEFGKGMDMRPEFVLVGYENLSKAVWTEHTSGSTESFITYMIDQSGKPYWKPSDNKDVKDSATTQTGETSENLEWNPDGTFHYKMGSINSGIGFNLTAVDVGGIWIPVDKLGLLSPYIGLASTIVVATVATAICVKRIKRKRREGVNENRV